MQILLTGIVFTLVSVLLIHLILTAQYHWPLAPVNYVLQLSGVCSLLISLIATLHVVLSAAFSESEKWPYMLSYIAVNVPPLDLDANAQGWTITERATWLIMNASTSGLVQITHIHFLTLLYPSRLEGRLIFALLGPLAVLAAVMQLLSISENIAVNTISWAVRNVCNATLSLLFTAALFIWGFLVNRKQAWRTDGGTAVFGSAALFLAVVSTGLSFLYVPREEEYVWLPGLMWAVVLWQSFLGWWWWVGAGSGGGFVEGDILKKVEREMKKGVRKRRRGTRIRAKNNSNGLAHVLPQGESQPCDSSTVGDSSIHQTEPCGPSDGSTSRRSSPTPPPARRACPKFIPPVAYRWYTSLCNAHQVAARQQAAERVEKIRELDRDRTCSGCGPGRGSSWGFGVFGRKPRGDSHQKQECDLDSSSQQLPEGEHCQEPEPHADQMRAIDSTVSIRLDRAEQPRSVWWWGVLSRWRLRDSTVY